MKSLIFFVFIIFCGHASADEWYIGTWDLDFDYMLEAAGVTEAELIELDKTMLATKYLRLVISEENITNTFEGKEISKWPYTLTKEKGVLSIKFSNAFGPSIQIITKTERGMCMEPILDTDRYGTYKPSTPFIKCFVQKNA